jgi:hypothetical protein
MRSHRTKEWCGWEPTGHYEDSTTGMRQPDIGSGSHPAGYAPLSFEESGRSGLYGGRE